MPRKSLIGSTEMLAWALGGIEREMTQTRERLAALTAQAAKIRAALGHAPAARLAGLPARRKRKAMSAEARKRISDAMKKRWAERKRRSKK
jgi:hypothetical protein